MLTAIYVFKYRGLIWLLHSESMLKRRNKGDINHKKPTRMGICSHECHQCDNWRETQTVQSPNIPNLVVFCLETINLGVLIMRVDQREGRSITWGQTKARTKRQFMCWGSIQTMIHMGIVLPYIPSDLAEHQKNALTFVGVLTHQLRWNLAMITKYMRNILRTFVLDLHLY